MTQWRVGFSGIYGTDYTVLPVVMDMHEISANERRNLFGDIRVMEAAALDEIATR